MRYFKHKYKNTWEYYKAPIKGRCHFEWCNELRMGIWYPSPLKVTRDFRDPKYKELTEGEIMLEML